MSSTAEIAAEIFAQMSEQDRKTFRADDWREGVSGMLVDDWARADAEKVLAAIGELAACSG